MSTSADSAGDKGNPASETKSTQGKEEEKAQDGPADAKETPKDPPAEPKPTSPKVIQEAPVAADGRPTLAPSITAGTQVEVKRAAWSSPRRGVVQKVKKGDRNAPTKFVVKFDNGEEVSDVTRKDITAVFGRAKAPVPAPEKKVDAPVKQEAKVEAKPVEAPKPASKSEPKPEPKPLAEPAPKPAPPTKAPALDLSAPKVKAAAASAASSSPMSARPMTARPAPRTARGRKSPSMARPQTARPSGTRRRNNGEVFKRLSQTPRKSSRVEKLMYKDCTFSPRINDKSLGMMRGMRPAFHKRIKEVIDNYHQYKARMRKKRPTFTFKPKVDLGAYKSKLEASGEFMERMQKDIKTKVERAEARRAETMKKLCPFSPRVHLKSYERRYKKKIGGGQNFWQRMSADLQRRGSTRTKALEAKAKALMPTFKPTITYNKLYTPKGGNFMARMREDLEDRDDRNKRRERELRKPPKIKMYRNKRAKARRRARD